MKITSRILMGLFAVIGIAGWTWVLLLLTQWVHSMAGMGDGAGTESHGDSPLAVLIVATIWLVPTMAFVFMLLGVLNLLKGSLRQIAYWYALVFLFLAAWGLLIFYPGVSVLKPLGFIFAFFTALWGFAFRELKNARGEIS